MAKGSDLDVAYVAKLARLNLSDAETELFQRQLGHVLNYADKLRRVDVSEVEAAAHAIPSALVLALIGIASWVVWIIAAISVLINETYPEGLWRFQRGVVRWEARLLGYIASLVEPYPPFSFDTGPAA